MKTINIHKYYYSKQKRIFDIVLSVISIIFLTPIWIIISLIISLTAGFPIVFIQKRAGLNKKSFKMIKFRTMNKNAHKLQKKYRNINQAPEPMFKIHNDPRFVGIGKFLSKTGIDETLQVFNILMGDMSFVGVRPLPIAEAKALSNIWSFRFKVKPGLFSFWTLEDDRHKSLNSWRKLEKMTLESGGFLFELKIILLTSVRQVGKFFLG